jgi:Putative zinc-finger
MNCEETKSLLSSFFDGELSAAERDGVAAHVEHCQTCASELAGLAELDRKSRLLHAQEPPADLWDRLAKQLAASRVRAAAPFGIATRRRFVLAGGALAASLVVGLLASTFVRRRNMNVAPDAEEPAGPNADDVVRINLTLLTPEDRQLAESQETCAREGCDMQLGSGGQPHKFMVKDTPVFCCSRECELWARAHPQVAVAKHNMLVARHQARIGAGAAP